MKIEERTEIEITPEMLRAGVRAYERWSADDEEKEALVAEIFYSMLDECVRPQDMRQLLRKQVTQALRQAKRLDEDGGFTYRAKQSVTLFEGGTAVKHYFDTDKGGTPTLRQKSTKQRREAIAHDVYRAVCDVERMNKVFNEEPQLSFLPNFSEDVAELRAAELMERDKNDDDDEP